ncbi:MAG: hypothetical protein M1320_00115 [Patescibacteria group bacterium]|nr:hypothetical protein [Patescibacteria group bacterium]
MGRLFFPDAINNMFDSDALPLGGKTRSVFVKRSRATAQGGCDPFDIMDRAVEAGNVELFSQFSQEITASAETFLGSYREEKEINLENLNRPKSMVDDLEDLFDSQKIKKRFSNGKMAKKPVVVSLNKLRLV